MNRIVPSIIVCLAAGLGMTCAGPTKPTAVDASAPSASTTLVAASEHDAISTDAVSQDAIPAEPAITARPAGDSTDITQAGFATQVVAALPPAPVQSVPAAPRPQPYRAPVYYQNPTERQQQICANGNCGTRVFSGRWLGRRR